MKKIIFCIISLSFLFPFSVNAYSCNETQISRYEQLANQIQTTFEYNETDDGLIFDILFHNVYKDFEVVDYYTYDYLITYENNNNTGITIASDYLPGKTYKFSILNNGKLCDMEIIREITVTTPNYNKYYKDPVCSDVSSFELCQKWANIGNVSYDNFVKSVNQYKEENQSDEIIIDDVINNDLGDNIRNFFAKYYMYIIIVLLIIVSLIMHLINRRNKDKW